MKQKFTESPDTTQTQELPKIINRRKELQEIERKNKLIVEKNRRELNIIAQQLTNLAERIPDTRTQADVFTGLMPTARAVGSNIIPESMEIELKKLNLIADTIARHLPESDASAEIVKVKLLVKNILDTVPML